MALESNNSFQITNKEIQDLTNQSEKYSKILSDVLIEAQKNIIGQENVLKKTSDIKNGGHTVIGFNKYRLSSDENINISNKIDLTNNDAFIELNITKLI